MSMRRSRSINVFTISYLVIFAASVLVIALDEFDLVTNFTAVAATFNNIGPGLSKVGPTMNFGSFSVLSKYVLMFDMAGRPTGAVPGAVVSVSVHLEKVLAEIFYVYRKIS